MHQHLLHTNRALTYGSDDGTFGPDDALQVVGAGVVLTVLAGVALAIGPNPISDPFGMKSRKRK
jgi:hypothetical protein